MTQRGRWFNVSIAWKQMSWLVIVCLTLPSPKQVTFANTTEKAPITQTASEPSPSLCTADLKSAIESIIQRPEFARSRWGILIQSLNSEETLYQLDANKYFIPASNVKVLTTAAAVLQLGRNFQIRTPIYSTGSPPHINTLRVVGKGDPTLTTEKLEALVQQLKEKGVQHISQLIIEDSYFQNPGLNSTWEWGDTTFDYGASINSLILNQNAVTLKLLPQKLGQPLQLNWSDEIAAKQWQIKNQAITAPANTSYTIEVNAYLGKPILEIEGELAIDAEPDAWGLAIIDPNQYFLEVFQSLLTQAGIKVDRALITHESQSIAGEIELGAILSDSLESLITETNQKSNNLFAESLLKITEKESNSESILEAIQTNLSQLGVKDDSYLLADGSGLSRHNLVTPEALVQTLKLMAKTPDAEIYKNSFAIAGVNGTLKKRFQDTPIQAHLHAKTGTLTGISALAGYLDLPNYQPLVFSIIIEQSNQPASSLRNAIDEIVMLLEKLQSC